MPALSGPTSQFARPVGTRTVDKRVYSTAPDQKSHADVAQRDGEANATLDVGDTWDDMGIESRATLNQRTGLGMQGRVGIQGRARRTIDSDA